VYKRFLDIFQRRFLFLKPLIPKKNAINEQENFGKQVATEKDK
jgi:hypothetical protein